MSFVVTDRVKPSFQDLPLRSLRRGIRKLQGDGSDGWEEDVRESALDTEDDDDSDDISLSTFHKLLHNRATLQDKQSPALIEKLWRIACPVLPRPEDYATHRLGPNDFRQFLRSWAAHVAAACPPEDPPVSAPAPPAEVARYRHVCAEKERAMIIFVENRTKETLQLLQGRSFCSEGEFSDSNVWQQGTSLVLQPSG